VSADRIKRSGVYNQVFKGEGFEGNRRKIALMLILIDALLHLNVLIHLCLYIGHSALLLLIAHLCRLAIADELRAYLSSRRNIDGRTKVWQIACDDILRLLVNALPLFRGRTRCKGFISWSR